MAKIFVSYRQTDSQYSTDLIYDRLRSYFGSDAIFEDVHNIRGGADITETIRAALKQASAMVVVIGPQWLAEFKRRHTPLDYVLFEIETALQSNNTFILPVVVQGASRPTREVLPQSIVALAEKIALTVNRGPDFDRDIEKIYAALTPYAPPVMRLENTAYVDYDEQWSSLTGYRSMIRFIRQYKRLNYSALRRGEIEFIGWFSFTHWTNVIWPRFAEYMWRACLDYDPKCKRGAKRQEVHGNPLVGAINYDAMIESDRFRVNISVDSNISQFNMHLTNRVHGTMLVSSHDPEVVRGIVAQYKKYAAGE